MPNDGCQTRFVLSTLKPMERISIDTIGPLPLSDMGIKYIIVIVDTFTRNVELFPKQVMAMAAADAAAPYSDTLADSRPLESLT